MWDFPYFFNRVAGVVDLAMREGQEVVLKLQQFVELLLWA